MSKSKDELLDKAAEHLTTCYYSPKGCFKIPVRMVAVLNNDQDDSADADMYCLCRSHAITFNPPGKVIFDKTMDEENIKILAELGI